MLEVSVRMRFDFEIVNATNLEHLNAVEHELTFGLGNFITA